MYATLGESQIQCRCNHLTHFAGGVFVKPNFVDPIQDALLFLTFFDNPVIVTAVVLLWMLYFITLYWARKADRQDSQKVIIFKLLSNKY